MQIQEIPLGEIPEAARIVWTHPPTRLYAQGTERARCLLSHLPDRGVAIVGTRRPLPMIRDQLKRWIHELTGADLIIVSGLALGIDGDAHRAALEAGIPTVAILGTPIGEPTYPPEHDELRARILASDGLILSEVSARGDMKENPFLLRNRLIAGLTRATWVVQAPARSGALNTATWASDFGRDLYATSCAPEDSSFRGNQKLLDRAGTRAFWGVHNLGETWLELSSFPLKAGQRRPGVTPDTSPAGLLASEIRRRSSRDGGCYPGELLEWASVRGWSPADYYEALERALQRGLARDRGGFLRA